MAITKQYITYNTEVAFNTTMLLQCFADIRDFYRYKEYYNSYITITDQIIKDTVSGCNQRILSRVDFDDTNLQKFNDFIAECGMNFNIQEVTINNALILAKAYSPARTIKDQDFRTKVISEYVINGNGILEQVIS